MKPVIGISIGDINGIGPEVVLKSLSEIDLDDLIPVIIGSEKAVRYYSSLVPSAISLRVLKSLDDTVTGELNILNPDPGFSYPLVPGNITKESGLHAMKCIQRGIEECMQNRMHALVTAPISKEAVNLAGYSVPGHTEFLAQQSGTPEVLMILLNEKLRIALATTHIPVKDIPRTLTKTLILKKIDILHTSLKDDFGISSPKIAVFGLNPHAGDGGFIGKEEINIIKPAIKEAADSGINITGPFAADSFFGSGNQENFDGILAMYHDQGLAPFKALSFGKGVNFTAGLPFIRTSPDHGTAFNIAGKGLANSGSFTEAFKLALTLIKKKNL